MSGLGVLDPFLGFTSRKGHSLYSVPSIMIAPFGCLNHLYLTEVLACEAHGLCKHGPCKGPV